MTIFLVWVLTVVHHQSCTRHRHQWSIEEAILLISGSLNHRLSFHRDGCKWGLVRPCQLLKSEGWIVTGLPDLAGALAQIKGYLRAPTPLRLLLSSIQRVNSRHTSLQKPPNLLRRTSSMSMSLPLQLAIDQGQDHPVVTIGLMAHLDTMTIRHLAGVQGMALRSLSLLVHEPQEGLDEVMEPF